MDCSHLVHYLYSRSGLDYVYADSVTLYEGVAKFRRVTRPQEGDVIVWRGHVGIVVDPDQHSFVSALRTGVKVSSYESQYWKRRGIPRFYRYVGTDSYPQPLFTAQARPGHLQRRKPNRPKAAILAPLNHDGGWKLASQADVVDVSGNDSFRTISRADR